MRCAGDSFILKAQGARLDQGAIELLRSHWISHVPQQSVAGPETLHRHRLVSLSGKFQAAVICRELPWIGQIDPVQIDHIDVGRVSPGATSTSSLPVSCKVSAGIVAVIVCQPLPSQVLSATSWPLTLRIA